MYLLIEVEQGKATVEGIIEMLTGLDLVTTDHELFAITKVLGTAAVQLEAPDEERGK